MGQRLELIMNDIRNNLPNISEGDIYASKSELYETLGLEKPSGGRNAKLLENEVKQYLDFEKFDDTSRKIIITEVFPEKIPKIDNRINNGGSHNQKYIQFVKPLILREANRDIERKDRYYTYLQIYQNAYRIPDFICKIISPMSDEISGFSKAEQEYINILNNKLYQITETALRSLQEEGIISYEKIEAVNNGNDDRVLSQLVLLKKEGWLQSVKLMDFLHMIGRLDSVDIDSIENLIKSKERSESVNSISLFNFAKLYSTSNLKRKEDKEIADGYRSIINNVDKEVFIKSTFPIKIENTRGANDLEKELIDALDQAITADMGYNNISTIIFDMRRRKEFYNIRNAVLRIMSWSPIYKRLHIDVLDYSKYKYQHEDEYNLKIALEGFMRERIENTKYNPSKDRKRSKHSFGVQINTREDEDHYWLNTDAVWALHKKVFADVLNDGRENSEREN